ncbi:hypothetical protein CPA40_07855 [Bifidobacterium callitrichos]|uniref:Uncharacterized protein n=1 Tax=Bifidobacterium callitrichos TaxID=762209 RepID=A0A2T3G915_9BIFI|nr:hypothetical protein CPA40_07855 [Bifidobacterium callitrichos]
MSLTHTVRASFSLLARTLWRGDCDCFDGTQRSGFPHRRFAVRALAHVQGGGMRRQRMHARDVLRDMRGIA